MDLVLAVIVYTRYGISRMNLYLESQIFDLLVGPNWMYSQFMAAFVIADESLVYQPGQIAPTVYTE